MTIAELTQLAGRYTVTPDPTFDGITPGHRHSDYDAYCILHCECSDHYYRMRDCKHIAAWLELRDAGKGR